MMKDVVIFLLRKVNDIEIFVRKVIYLGMISIPSMY